jgi:heme exporter protein C
MFSTFANPQRFMQLSAWLMPAVAALAVLLFAIGLPWALLYSPPDYLQKESARILYIHVPAAWMALGVYTVMGVASFVYLIWRHTLADVAARAAAPIGCAFAGLCLVTGSLWGQPTWGTWWVWDARLTSMLILFLTYVGYLALRAAIEDENRAALMAAILCLAGLLNIPIIRFSVEWWSSLHQGASIDVVKAVQGKPQAMHATMLQPLLVMAAAHAALFASLLMAGMRTEIYRRQVQAALLRKANA